MQTKAHSVYNTRSGAAGAKPAREAFRGGLLSSDDGPDQKNTRQKGRATLRRRGGGRSGPSGRHAAQVFRGRGRGRAE